jgi:hypothetical protein
MSTDDASSLNPAAADLDSLVAPEDAVAAPEGETKGTLESSGLCTPNYLSLSRTIFGQIYVPILILIFPTFLSDRVGSSQSWRPSPSL